MPVYAYIDPSVMTYAIQAIAGIAVALGTFFSLYWRKVKKWLIREMDLNETAKSGSESDELYYYDPSCMDEAKTITVSSKTDKQAETENGNSFIRDLIPALWLAAAGCFMLCIYGPLEIFMNNKNEFWFDFSVLFPQLLRMFVIFILAVMILAAVVRKISRKAYKILLWIASTILVGMLIQGTFLVKNMPPMDGTAIDWSVYKTDNLISALMFILIGGAILYGLLKLSQKGYFFVIKGISACTAVLMAVMLAIVTVTTNGTAAKKIMLISDDGIYEYSDKTNYIVLVLDALDGAKFSEVLEKHPEYRTQFEDFTFFPDTMSLYPFTSRAIPHMLTGEVYENEGDFTEFTTQAMDNSEFLKKLEDADYQMGMYEKDLVYDSENVTRFNNIEFGSVQLNPETKNYFMKNQLFLVLFKYLPYGLKQYVPIDLNAFDGLMDNSFMVYNSIFVENLRDADIKTTDSNQFKFIHLEGAHVPFKYNADVTIRPDYDGTYELNIEACATLTDYYLTRLKEAGVYDNSVIIVLADHGYSEDLSGIPGILDRSNPFLMVKGIHEKHPFEISEQPVTYLDLSEALERLLDGETADTAFSFEQNPDGRRYLMYEYEKEDHMEEYYQKGYAWENDTMIPSGEVYDYK
jgi:hypothetical protein